MKQSTSEGGWKVRVFIATLGTETNTFASFPTGIDDFRRGFWTEDGIDSVPTSPWSAPAKVLDNNRLRFSNSLLF